VKFSIDTTNAVVAVQSLDNMAINESNKILISKIARCMPANKKSSPFICEPVIGSLFIKAKPNLTLHQVMPNSTEKKISSQYSDEHGYEVKLSADITSPWLILRAE